MKAGDYVFFTHMQHDEPFAVKAVKDTIHGPMVELVELPGDFAEHLFVEADPPSGFTDA